MATQSNRKRPRKNQGITVAFFDVDHTLVDHNASKSFIRNLWHEGLLSTSNLMLTTWHSFLHRIGRLNEEKTLAKAYSVFAGWNVKECERLCKKGYDRFISGRISSIVFEEFRYHQSLGHKTVLLTTMPDVVAGVVASELEVDDFLCSVPERKGGKYTGRVGHIMYGAAKGAAIKEYCKQHGVDSKNSFCYADSFSDVSALEAVGNPVAVHPDKKLKRHAKKRGWKIIKH